MVIEIEAIPRFFHKPIKFGKIVGKKYILR